MTDSFWHTLDEKGDHPALSSGPLYSLLSERSKFELTRPQRIHHVEMDEVVERTPMVKAHGVTSKRNILNTTYIVLNNPQTNEYFRLDEKEKFLWDHMDGDHTIKDLAIAYFQKFGSFAYDKIVELVYDLQKKTFLTDPYEQIYETLTFAAQSRRLFYKLWNGIKRITYWEFPLPHTESFFAQLYRSGGRALFLPVLRVSLALVALGGFGVFLWMHPAPSTNIVLFLTLNFLSLIIHELAHGLTTVHFGRKVHKAGFLLYFGLPAFFVDTTDMWMEEKPKRIAVTLAGAIGQAIVAGIASLLLLAPLPSTFYPLLSTFAFVSYLSIFVNMNPLIEWDGYFLLMDLVGIPCLRKRSLHFIQKELLTKLAKREAFSREELLYAVFGTLAAVWSIAAIFFGIQFWTKLL